MSYIPMPSAICAMLLSQDCYLLWYFGILITVRMGTEAIIGHNLYNDRFWCVIHDNRCIIYMLQSNMCVMTVATEVTQWPLRNTSISWMLILLQPIQCWTDRFLASHLLTLAPTLNTMQHTLQVFLPPHSNLLLCLVCSYVFCQYARGIRLQMCMKGLIVSTHYLYNTSWLLSIQMWWVVCRRLIWLTSCYFVCQKNYEQE